VKSRVKPVWSAFFAHCLTVCASLLFAFATFAQTIPNGPTNLTASATSLFQINLAWSDTSTNEDGFRIERSSDGTNFAQIAQVLSNGTSYLSTGLFPGKTYFYRLSAYNAGGDSAYTGVANASTPPLCDTTVVGWGWNDYGQTTPPAGLTGAVAIVAGYFHSEALRSDGTVVGWGMSYYAAPPAGLTGVVAISAGIFHTLALKSNGTVVAWGDTYYGQSSVPVGLSDVVAVAAGYQQSLALKSDGTVVAWGSNTYGAVAAPAGLSNVVAISAGGYHNLALKSDGTVVAWGDNYYGQSNVPFGLTGVIAIAAGGFHSLALKNDGSVVGWGDNSSGQSGLPAGLTNVWAIAAGWSESLALKSDGTVVGYGYSNYGQTMPPPGLTGVIGIAAGVYHSLALSRIPGAPSSITLAAASASQVNLSWSNTANMVAGFNIERAPDSSGSPGGWTQIAAVAGTVTNYSDTGLTTNTTYWYRMQAYNACTNSIYTTPVSAVTAPPPAPLNLVAEVVATNQVNLSWINNYPDVAGFTIERALDGGGSPGTWTQIATVGGSVTSYTDTGAVANTTYWYRVRANNALGDSPNSDQVIGFVSGGQLITVMQWNVRGGLGRIDNNNSASARAIARIVNYNQPDVLLFNEIDTQGLTSSANTDAMIDWVTNNVTYLGSEPGVTFWVAMSSQDDGFIRNGAISRYPISNDTTYDDGLRGLHSFRLKLNGTNALQVFHAHLKCCADDCAKKHDEAQFDADTISSWAATNSLPYIFGGDWNDDRESPVCGPPYTTTTIRQGSGLAEFKPTTLDGDYRTWSSSSPSIRFDYLLAASNRLNAVSGYVFSTMDWATHGLYTDTSPQNLVNDSQTASDHFCVFVKYFFPSPDFPVTPTNAFASVGNLGGPFSPTQQVYTLNNTNSIPLSWSVTKSASWLTISATNGVLLGGASTNITVSVNATASSLPVGSYADKIGLVSATIDASLLVLWPPPVADFTGSPTNGLDPMTVTFADTSTGPITDRFWSFGDGGTTNVTTNTVVVHTYSAGSYDVTLVASGPGGVSTNTQPNYIGVTPAATISVVAADLQDRFGSLMPTSGVAVLVADTGANGFVDPQATFPLNLGANWGVDDKIVGLWDLANSYNDFWGQPGGLADQTTVAYTGGIAAGQKLQLYWFPSLTLASNTVGVTYYGKYADTSTPPLDGSAPWSLPASATNVELDFYTQSEGGSNPDTAGQAALLTTVPLTAFQNWQIQNFGSTNNPAAAEQADPDGDGQNNLAEFLAGTDPNNSRSGLRIVSTVQQSTDVVITWTTIGGHTNIVQATGGETDGSYSTNGFADIPASQTILSGSGDSTTNYTDTGGATNAPSRYYRIRLVP
jgi:PKD repeat protein/endonuclease/exonuclease/phosphatase family metal-dependent hydrolase